MEASKLKDRLEQEWPGNDWDGDQSAVLSVEGSDDTKLSCFHAPNLQFFTLLFVHEEIMRLYCYIRSPLGPHSKRELISGCFIPIS